MIDITKWSEYFNFIVPAITAIFGAFTAIIFNKFKKRLGEVEVTGTEHDTVKRISQSSIETIENLNAFVTKMTEKTLAQRTEFATIVDSLQNELRQKDEIITTQKNEIHKLNIIIDKLNNESIPGNIQ